MPANKWDEAFPELAGAPVVAGKKADKYAAVFGSAGVSPKADKYAQVFGQSEPTPQPSTDELLAMRGKAEELRRGPNPMFNPTTSGQAFEKLGGLINDSMTPFESVEKQRLAGREAIRTIINPVGGARPDTGHLKYVTDATTGEQMVVPTAAPQVNPRLTTSEQATNIAQGVYDAATIPTEEFAGSPLGLASLPILPAKAAVLGGRSVLGIGAGAVGKVGGKALTYGIKAAGLDVNPTLARFVRTPELVKEARDSSLAYRAGEQQVGEISSELAQKYTPDQLALMDKAGANVNSIRAEAINQLRIDAIKAEREGMRGALTRRKQLLDEARVERGLSKKSTDATLLEGATGAKIGDITPGITSDIELAEANAKKQVGGYVSDSAILPPLKAEDDLAARAGLLESAAGKSGQETIDALGRKIEAPTQAALLKAQASQEREIAKTYAKRISDLKRMKAEKLGVFAEMVDKDVAEAVKQEALRKGLSHLSPELQGATKEIMARFDEYADRQIAAGIPREVFATYKGTYIPQLYKEPELEVGKYALAKSFQPKSKIWTDRMKGRVVTSSEKANELGASHAGLYNVTKGMLQESRSTASLEMYQRIANNGALSSVVERPGWVQIPNNPKAVGLLAGKYVHPSVAAELSGPNLSKDWAKDWISRIKRSVTILNPPVHFGNIVSNAILMDFAGFPMGDIGAVRAALESLRSGDETYKALSKTGIVSKYFQLSGKELDNVTEMALEAARRNTSGDDWALDFLTRVLVDGKNAKFTMDGLYNAEEQIGKYILAHYGYTKGIPLHGLQAGSALDAARHADKWLINYADLPVGWKEMRQNVAFNLLATPFVTFSLKSTPLMAEGMVKAPHKFMKWHSALASWNEASRRAVGISDEQWAKYKQDKVDAAGNSLFGLDKLTASISPEMILPITTNGGFYAMGVGRFTPWNNAVQPRQTMAGGLATAPFIRSMETAGMGPAYSANVGSFGTPGFGTLPKVYARLAQTAAAGAPYAPIRLLATPPAQRAIGAAVSPLAKYSFQTEEGIPGPANLPAKYLDLMGMPATRSTGEKIGPWSYGLSATIASPYEVNLQRSATAKWLRVKREQKQLRGAAVSGGARIVSALQNASLAASGSPQSSEGPPPNR